MYTINIDTKGVLNMKFYLDEKKIRKIITERGNTITSIVKHLELSHQETYNKIQGKNGIDIKLLNKLCLLLMVGAENILTEDSLDDLEEYRKDIEYMDGLNAQY